MLKVYRGQSKFNNDQLNSTQLVHIFVLRVYVGSVKLSLSSNEFNSDSDFLNLG